MRILFVTARPPWPGRRGDQARVAGFVRELGGDGGRHEISVLSLRGPGLDAGVAPAGVELETVEVGPVAVASRLLQGAFLGLLGLSRRPFQIGFFDHTALRGALRRRLRGETPDVVVLVTSRLGHLLPEVRRAAPRTAVVVDLVDALTLNFRHRAGRERPLRWLWKWESRRLARWEAELVAASDAAAVVAERDRRAVAEGAGVEHRRAVEERLEVVPYGLRIDGRDAAEPTEPAEGTEPLVVLTGNLGYFPTVDGACFFARRAWPAVRRRVPGARWRLAGARPARAVRELAALDGVEVVADPPDLVEATRGAQVALAPLRSGSGTPIKILEAMARGIPVVATPEAAAGLDDLPPGALAVASEGESFATAVGDLLLDPERRREMARRARTWLSSRHGLPASAHRFEALLERALRRGGHPRGGSP